ncbi:MAG: SufS family cysteine desulfurase [Candidatus Peribacteraceae bacterium]|nr:SufS family cysteine desulfurase [Candidatus Peribacteraceae bacterium]
MLDLPSIRRQFPILSQKIDGKPLIYLDSAATTQKPQAVLDRMQKFYGEENANVHRGMHVLAERATVAYEHARVTVQNFLNAQRPEEIIFTKSCTESINLVARSWGRAHLREGDAVVLTVLEHHSNVVPWLQLKEDLGIDIQWIDIDDHGHLKTEMLDAFLKKGNVKLVAVTAQSNVLGVRPPLPDIITKAHAHGALVLVDAAQSVAHHQTDVQELDCDFLAFSGHKLYGPGGIGVLYGKKEHLESMPPFLGGGMMIQEVHQDRFTPADIPQKFEAGTPAIAEAVGLAAAIEWIGQYSWEEIEDHEQSLIAAAVETLHVIPKITILGPGNGGARHGSASLTTGALPLQSGCLSFVTEGVHPHDLTEILGRQGICLRAGHHCTQPLHRRLGITASTRLSVGIYNTEEEITPVRTAVIQAVKKLSS